RAAIACCASRFRRVIYRPPSTSSCSETERPRVRARFSKRESRADLARPAYGPEPALGDGPEKRREVLRTALALAGLLIAEEDRHLAVVAAMPGVERPEVAADIVADDDQWLEAEVGLHLMVHQDAVGGVVHPQRRRRLVVRLHAEERHP